MRRGTVYYRDIPAGTRQIYLEKFRDRLKAIAQ